MIARDTQPTMRAVSVQLAPLPARPVTPRLSFWGYVRQIETFALPSTSERCDDVLAELVAAESV